MVVKLEALLECHVDEKKTHYLACRLIGLSDGDQKYFERIKEVLYNEFLKGQLGREVAIVVLENRQVRYSPFAYAIVNDIHWFHSVAKHSGNETVWRYLLICIYY